MEVNSREPTPSVTRTLDTLPPEIIHYIFELLKIEDVRRLRRVSRQLGAIGACHALPELVFYLHQGDLNVLRTIARHPVYPTYVRSLIYGTDVLENEQLHFKDFTPDCRKILREAAREHRDHDPKKCALARAPPPTIEDIKEKYRLYKRVLQQQHEVLDTRFDFEVLKEVIPKLPNLQEIIVSSDYEYRDSPVRGFKTPFDELATEPRLDGILGSEGVRHLEALLEGVYAAYNDGGMRGLKALRAGLIHFSFFDGPHQILLQMPDLLAHLTSFELLILPESDIVNRGGELEYENCQALMRTGVIRNLVRRMPNLETLSIAFDDHTSGDELLFPASLRDLVPLKHTWPNLEKFRLENVETDRDELTAFLVLHKESLMNLHLHAVRLKTTSWRKLLPQLKVELDTHLMDEVLISGVVFGQSEDPPGHGLAPGMMDDGEEEWFLGDDNDPEETLALAVEDYFMSPTKMKCPLTRSNMNAY